MSISDICSDLIYCNSKVYNVDEISTDCIPTDTGALPADIVEAYIYAAVMRIVMQNGHTIYLIHYFPCFICVCIVRPTRVCQML